MNKSEYLAPEGLARKKNINPLPAFGFVRLRQIIGDPKAGIPPIIPVTAATWWSGCKSGQFPAPVKLSPKVTVWRAEDIRALVERVSKGEDITAEAKDVAHYDDDLPA